MGVIIPPHSLAEAVAGNPPPPSHSSYGEHTAGGHPEFGGGDPP
jgi:hypothetical protein